MDEEMELQVCQMWFNIVVAAAPGEGEITAGTAGRQCDIWPHGTGIPRIVLSRAVLIHVREEWIYRSTPTSICLKSACVGVCVSERNAFVCLFMDVKSFSVWHRLNAWFVGGFMCVMVSEYRTSFTPGINICLIWSQVDCTKHKCKWGTKWKHIWSLNHFWRW